MSKFDAHCKVFAALNYCTQLSRCLFPQLQRGEARWLQLRNKDKDIEIGRACQA